MITTRACSREKSTFIFPAAAHVAVLAEPHAELNGELEKLSGLGSEHLGFLRVHAPYHYHFDGVKVRRTPMFLSYKSTRDEEVDEPSTSLPFVACVDDHVPVAYNFPLEDGIMIPLSTLAGVMPTRILWEETDLPSAKMLQYKEHRWFTRPTTLQEEREAIYKLMDPFRGVQGGVSLLAHRSGERNDEAAVPLILEAIDPRGHRRPDCFRIYYRRYVHEQPFSGTQFFDWLDFGQGRYLLEDNDETGTRKHIRKDDLCYKKYFNRLSVHYFDDEERKEHEVYLTPNEDGTKLIAKYKISDKLVPKSDKDDPHLYMWDLNSTLYVVDNTWDREKFGVVKHTSVVAGKASLSAGKAYFGEDGSVWGINYSSGHYRPTLRSVSLMYQWVKDNGWNTTAFHWVGRMAWEGTNQCEEVKWTETNVPGYNNADLEASCHEVIKSPTWVLYDDV